MSLKLNRAKLPRVAVIGRPNVGKSTLFNALIRERRSVVKNQPGVTRDLLIENTEWWGRAFQVVDTGGITDSEDMISALIKTQVLGVLKECDLLVVVMDGKVGLVPEDRDLLRIAKETGKPFILAVNKVDKMEESSLVVSEFYEFGVDLVPCSFEQKAGIDELVEWIIARAPEEEIEERAENIRIAIVGKPNVGKSSLCNRLLQKERVLVSPRAGTTIDSVEIPFRYGEQDFLLVDTAGLRRSARRAKDHLEKISALKSQKAIHHGDVVLLMIDAQEGPTDQDLKIAEAIIEEHKAFIVVANKIDLAKIEDREYRNKFKEKIQKEFHFFPHVPVVFICAQTGEGVPRLFNKVQEIWEKLHTKITTSKLNDFFYSTIRQAPSPVYGTTNVKFYYLTQTRQTPPSFIAFANHPKGVTPSYRRFLVKRIQRYWKLEEVPVRLFIMKSANR